MKISSIYYADDDRDDLELFKVAASRLGLSPFLFDHAKSMLNAIEIMHPDLVFIDINMPVVNGFAALSHIRSQSEFNAIPVVMYSTSRNPAEMDFAYEHGANFFLQKPTSLQKLTECIEKLCNADWSFRQRELDLTTFAASYS